MTLKLTRRFINQLFIRRFVSNDSSVTTIDPNKELTTKKPSEISTPKRAFTLINPQTAHQIRRIDDAPVDNEIDFIRHRLTEKRVKNIPIETDILIIGGAIQGSAIAFFLKQRAPDLKVTVIERDWNYTTSSTVLSAGGLRQQFALEENIQMSVYGAEFLKHIRDHLSILDNDPVPVTFHHNGYLLCGSEKSVKLFEENYKTQTSLGAKLKLLTPIMLKKQCPWLNTDGIAIGCFGVQNEGWLDPWAFLTAFRQKALSLGVLYLNAELVGFDKAKRIWADGTIENQLDKALILSAEDNRIYPMDAAFVINAAGPWAGEVAKMAGIGVSGEYPVALPVEPR
ncbi:unnamed protein product [Rotaria sp. Silwood2]|nr:unnamed protein product [Rotaria sp. Silwood2]CAF2770777.1 unnamed protein product [Rotaria sp. Silwood2]CAF3016054.1 unnamed protein product [Rotaria sp. Silwood2]CAF3909673.1 unnamed protein product [Rotaria sp. Silwood2]CAF4002823.1 unnamed protein product [Rotaria sp. Silwood2]